jgi:hypothetical protein
MRGESLVPFVPAALAAVTDGVTAAIVRGNQSDYPARFVAFQIVMFGAALLAAVPNKWLRFVGFVLLLAGVFISGNDRRGVLSSDVFRCRMGNGER